MGRFLHSESRSGEEHNLRHLYTSVVLALS